MFEMSKVNDFRFWINVKQSFLSAWLAGSGSVAIARYGKHSVDFLLAYDTRHVMADFVDAEAELFSPSYNVMSIESTCTMSDR